MASALVPVDRATAAAQKVPTDGSATALVYGVLRIGTALVALQLDALREVVPCPTTFESLPATACGLLGALKLRGKVVPVVDLRHVLGLPVETLAAPVVVVMRHEGRLLGLLSDSVHGITRPRAVDLHRIDSADGGVLLFCGSFERPEDRSVVSVIDAAAVLRLPGVPTLRDDGGDATALSSRPGQARWGPPMMLVRCGDVGLALEVLDVHTTLPHVSVKPSCMGGNLCPGLIEYRDIDVPALDPLALLGLGQLPSGERCQALLLRLPGGFVAVLVNEVIDIVPVADDERMRLSDAALQRPGFFSGLLRPEARGEYLALAAGTLAADPDVQGLSTMNVQRHAPAGAPRDGAVRDGAVQEGAVLKGRSVISFDLGTQAATALLQVREIVPMPAERIPTHSSHPAVLGLFTHRRQAVMLVCLARLMGGTARHDGGARVLLIDAAPAPGEPSQAIGFVVPRLCGIETARWEQPATPAASPSASKAFAGYPLIEVGGAGQRRTLPLLDLHALARALILERRHRWPATPEPIPDQAVTV